MVEVSSYGAPMHAAPLDGRDDTGGDGGDGGPDGHEDGGTSEHARRLPAAAGLIGVLGALIAGLWLLSLTGDDGISTDQNSDPLDEDPFEVPTTSSPLREPETMVEVAPEAEGLASATPTEPFSGLHGRLVYLSGSHVVRLDLATGAVERVPIEAFGSILALADMTLLTDGKRTVGLSLTADDPPTSVLVASDALVVPSTEPLADFWVISRPHGPAGAIRLNAWQDYGVLTGELQAPPGSEVLVTPDAGPLVNPPVGGTFRPTFAGFQAVGEHRLLAGGGGLRVEQRCDERLACAIVAVDANSDQATQLPQEFVAEIAGISVSPDGRWLLNDTSPAWLFDLDTQELRLLDVGGYGQPQWSDDSGSVAWLTSDQTPTLVIALTEPPEREKGWLIVELAGLGVDPSPGTSFLLDSTP